MCLSYLSRHFHTWYHLCAKVFMSVWLVASGRCCHFLINSVEATDRRSQAVAEFMSEGQLDVSRRQELSVVLNSDQTCVQGGGPAITQGGQL